MCTRDDQRVVCPVSSSLGLDLRWSRPQLEGLEQGSLSIKLAPPPPPLQPVLARCPAHVVNKRQDKNAVLCLRGVFCGSNSNPVFWGLFSFHGSPQEVEAHKPLDSGRDERSEMRGPL